MQGYTDHKKSSKHDTTKHDTNKLSVNNPKEIKIYELPNKEFKMITLKKLMRYKRTQKEKKKSEQCMNKKNKKSRLTLLSSLMRCIPELSTLRTKGGRVYPSVLTPYWLRLAS